MARCIGPAPYSVTDPPRDVHSVHTTSPHVEHRRGSQREVIQNRPETHISWTVDNWKSRIMASAAGAHEIVKKFKWKILDNFEKIKYNLMDDLISLIPVSREIYLKLKGAGSKMEKTDKILNLIIERGEPACERFLRHLKNMLSDFPKLSNSLNEFPEYKNKNFEKFLVQLGMKNYINSKLSMKNVLNIRKKKSKGVEPQKIQDLPWHFLEKLMALNRNARNTHYKKELSNQGSGIKECNVGYNKIDGSSSLHPLDMVCALLHCSDHFLQQEIVSKMSMCQFAVPLLLPAGDGIYCTLMLWAMRDIVKRWRPHSLADSKGFMEDNVVNVSMPTFSFVRLGKTKLSKSKILNQVLSQDQQHLDFFIHNDMQGGNIERKISNGLVEMSWYFPSGSKSSDIFPEPIAVTNLRGDLESNWNQFSFLSRVSTAVFIFTESIGDRESRILSNCNLPDIKYFFIISQNPSKKLTREKREKMKKVLSSFEIGPDNIIYKMNTDNDTFLTEKIKSLINSSLIQSLNKVNFHDAVNQAGELPAICVDEHSETCRNAREYAQTITKDIKDVIQYKKETMSLQGDLWKQVSEIEKEICRMRKQGEKDAQEYQSELLSQRISLQKEQKSHNLPHDIMLFINAYVNLSPSEKHYFLKWMKLELDSIARRSLFDLQTEYKEKCNKEIKNKEELKELDQKICDSSLGIEHFLREMGQFYEAECSMLSKNLIQEKDRQYTKLPGIAADLLLDGFPLELIDGDASNIPLQWMNDVLTELDTKTGGRCRMRVITVLGVQSTGKSTLLNTMFGLQFPVASGRCTRGAFMTLIRVEEDFIEELGCDFILVIDTEGLKAPELASLEDSYEHDNELATLVIGLSDITIINMAMENTVEMKDILQIVVHAFLRMKEIGKKPNCQFVHQNVSDVSAHDKNMRHRKKLLENLNEMTKTAAEMEKINGITSFNSVMDYDIETNNWYIPGLWHGVPPMAPVNYGYSEKVAELKKYLFEFMKSQKTTNTPYNIKQFNIWIDSLWKAVKHEKFIFSFRNSLVADAYNKLSIQFSQWEWDFTKAVYRWVSDTETRIRNQSPDTLHTDTLTCYEDELQQVLFEEEKKMRENLEKYFESKSENVHLIERYREDFFLSVEFLKKDLERKAVKTCRQALDIQKGKLEIQSIQDEYQEKIQCKVFNLRRTCRENKRQLSDRGLEEEFETMWKTTISELQIKPLQSRDINRAILQQLRTNMNHHGSNINAILQEVMDIQEYGNKRFSVETNYSDASCLPRKRMKLHDSQEEYNKKVTQFSNSLIETCERSIQEKVSTKWDYNDSHFKELLSLIDNKLKSKDVEKLHVTSEFELQIKLLVSGRAAVAFQKMHEDYIRDNDPHICLEKLKPQYFITFQTIYQEKDQSQQRAHQFCDLCLKPALTQYIYRHLGREIVDNVLNGSANAIYKSRSFFQAAVLKNLLDKLDPNQYLAYINTYESFLKHCLQRRVSDKYRNSSQIETLQTNLLSVIVRKTKDVLRSETCLKSENAANLLKNLCEDLKSELVIPQTEINMVLLGNDADVVQFAGDIQTFLIEVEKQIITEIKSTSFHSILSKVTVKPEDELLEKVIGCGKQCPFCKVPCEAGGSGHKVHFASIHRPQGLGMTKCTSDERLVTGICSTFVTSEDMFDNADTAGKLYPYKNYRTFYPDWHIQPDPSIESSDYWKYVFVKFNDQFAEVYKAKPAELPDGWKEITKEQALRSLKEAFNVK